MSIQIKNQVFAPARDVPRGVSRYTPTQDTDTLVFEVPSGRTVNGIFITSDWQLKTGQGSPYPIIGACQMQNYVTKYTVINSGSGARTSYYSTGIEYTQEGNILTVVVTNSTQAIFKGGTTYECYMRW